MAQKVKVSAQWDDIEILKYPVSTVGGGAKRHVVLDLSDSGWPTVSLGAARTVITAGTIIGTSTTSPDKHIRFRGLAGQRVTGIIDKPIDIVANTTGGDVAASVYFKNVIFNASKIVDYSTYNAILSDVSGSDMHGCQFEPPDALGQH